MAEFTGGNEECISVREPIVFENKTESQYEVCAGIVFHKSGIYEVSAVGNRTVVSEVPKRKTGKWIEHKWTEEENGLLISNWECSLCGMWERKTSDFCPNCGAKMEAKKC